MTEFENYKQSMIKAREVLIDDLSQRDFIVFVGAGVSEFTGVKLWPGILKALNDYRPDENKKIDIESFLHYDYPSAAQMLYERYQENGKIKAFYDIIKQQVQATRWPDCGLQQEIIKLSGRIITTNFDDTLESAFRTLQKSCRKQCLPKLTYKKVCRKYSITYLHGNFSQHENSGENEIIFRTEDYAKYYSKLNRGRESCVEKILSNIYRNPKEAIVFIGFSFDDEYIKRTFARINKEIKNEHLMNINNPSFRPYLSYIKHYALLSCEVQEDNTNEPTWRTKNPDLIKKKTKEWENEKKLNEELKNMQINVWRYSKGKHIELKPLFDEIAQRREGRAYKEKRSVIAYGSPNEDIK